MKILVTGGTGTIGSHLVKTLKEKNADFKVLTRNEEKADKLSSEGVETIVGNFNNSDSLLKAMEGVDRIFLLTPASVDQVELNRKVIDSAKKAGVDYIVKVSAIGSKEDSNVSLARAHAKTEQEIRFNKFDYTFLHPHSFMQNLIGMREAIRAGRHYGTTGQTGVPYVDTRDVAEVAAEALTSNDYRNKVLPVTGPQALTGEDVAKAFSDILDKPVEYHNVPHEMMQENMINMGIPKWLAEDLTNLNRSWSLGQDVEVSTVTEQVTGRPARTIRDFVRDYKSLFE
jgi:uncharacterized protein YbjT (DUF2867 family)